MTREEAITLLKKLRAFHNGTYAKAIDTAIEALEELPKRRKEAKRWKRKALKVEPVKHGRWEDTKYVNVQKCSCCQAEWGIYSIEDFDYCPNCGAKMDKEIEDDG